MKPQSEKITNLNIDNIKILKSKVVITINSNKFDLTLNTFAEFRLFKNKEITYKEFNKILEFNNNDKMLQYALSLISKSDISSFLLKEKLKKKFVRKETIDFVINYLKRHDLLDDKSYLFNLIELYEYKKYGYTRIVNECHKKGIDRKLINENYFINLDKEYEFCKYHFEKLINHKSNHNYNKTKKSNYDALVRLGFNHNTICEIFIDYPNIDEKHELELLKKDYNKLKGLNNFEIKTKLINKGYLIKHIDMVIGG